MAVSNPATLLSVYTEFGAPVNTPLSAFVRGGAWVPNTAANAGVPTTLPIGLASLAGAVNYTPMSGATANGLSETTSNTTTNYTTVGQSTATVSGGNPTKTYSWALVSGTSFTINSPTSASTTFTEPGKPPAGTYSGLYACTINDGTGSITTNNATITITRT